MKMAKRMNKMLIVFLLIISLAMLVLLVRLFSGEDSWIKDEKGIYVKHGYPSETPDYVREQQLIISKALELYEQKKTEMNLSSQCLGAIDNYAVDIAHVPRAAEDNLAENQCEDYRRGKVSHFIELDKEGSIVRIA